MTRMRLPLSLVAACAACGARPSAVENRGRPEVTWYAREVRAMPTHATMREYALHRNADRATLTIVERRVRADGRPPLDWSAATTVSRTTYAGTVTGEVFQLEASPDAPSPQAEPAPRPEPTLRWRCVQGPRDVGSSSAVRRMRADAPVGESACGVFGEWSPPAQPTHVLACSDVVPKIQPREIVFGQPGIEYVGYTDDGCQMLGYGHRALDREHTFRRFDEK